MILCSIIIVDKVSVLVMVRKAATAYFQQPCFCYVHNRNHGYFFIDNRTQ